MRSKRLVFQNTFFRKIQLSMLHLSSGSAASYTVPVHQVVYPFSILTVFPALVNSFSLT